jgi:multidrug resistance efflux pump
MKSFILIATVAAVLAISLFVAQGREGPLVVSGILEADEIRVGSRVGGRVARVHVEEGQRVAVGDPLVELQAFDLDALRAQAEALVAARRAEHERVKAGYREEEIAQAQARRAQSEAKLALLVAGPREQEIQAGRARVELAGAEFELAELEHERARQLHSEKVDSQDNVDRKLTEVKVSRATLEMRKQELALLELGTRAEEITRARAELQEAVAAEKLVAIGYRPEEVASALAELQAAEAALGVIESRRGELAILSPIEGTVEAIDLRPGDLVGADAPVLSLVDPTRLWVRAYVPENRLDLQLEQQVELAVDSFPAERFPGRIGFIARSAEFIPRNVQTPEERSKQVFRIKVYLESGTDRLRPGMAADVYLGPVPPDE